jgi:hypothetical protein
MRENERDRVAIQATTVHRAGVSVLRVQRTGAPGPISLWITGVLVVCFPLRWISHGLSCFSFVLIYSILYPFFLVSRYRHEVHDASLGVSLSLFSSIGGLVFIFSICLDELPMLKRVLDYLSRKDYHDRWASSKYAPLIFSDWTLGFPPYKSREVKYEFDHTLQSNQSNWPNSKPRPDSVYYTTFHSDPHEPESTPNHTIPNKTHSKKHTKGEQCTWLYVSMFVRGATPVTKDKDKKGMTTCSAMTNRHDPLARPGMECKTLQR